MTSRLPGTAQMPARRSQLHLDRKGPVASLGDHHIRCLDHRESIVADFEREIVHGLVSDRGGDNDATADVDADVRRRLTFGNTDDLALELVASAEFHHTLLRG